MKDITVAGRYAKALELLVERHVAAGEARIELLQRLLAELRSLAELVRPGSRVGGLLANPQVPPDEKRALLKRALDGRAERMLVVFADLLLRKKRLVLVDEIARDFATLVDKARGVRQAQVVSAVPLTTEELARVHAGLEKMTRGKIILSSAVDPELIGGAYARIGDRIVDRSVRSLLQSIADRLYEVSV